MQTIDFYPKSFHEIPEQDNPAFYGTTCMMIVREVIAGKNSDKALVLHIKPNSTDTVTRVATFWRHSMALQFCNNSTGLED